jgi:uncharacterized protein Veg
MQKIHNGMLHNPYPSPNTIRVIQSRKIRWAWHEAQMGKMINLYKNLARKSEENRELGRLQSKWEY